MTGLDSKSLLALGLKRLPNRVWTGSHYRTRTIVTLEDSRIGFHCENRDGTVQWFSEVIPTTLDDMGLRRGEDHVITTKETE